MIRRITNKKLENVVDSFVHNGIPFKCKVTNGRTELYSKVGNYMNKEGMFPSHELNFIKSVKANIIKKKLYEKIPNKFLTEKERSTVKYYTYNNRYKAGSIVDNIYEVDMKSAYWNMLNSEGLLTEKLYSDGNYVSKKSRLAAVGTLAKKTEIYEFDGVQQHTMPEEISELTEHIWYHICDKVGNILAKIARACGKDFVFFWVDGIFIHKNSLEKVKSMMAEEGFNFSVDKCKYIKFEEKKLIVKGKGSWTERDGVKVFETERPFPYKPTMKEIIEDRYA